MNLARSPTATIRKRCSSATPGGAHPERLGGHRPQDRLRGPAADIQGAHDEERRRILTERIEDLHTLAKALLEYETLTGDEIVSVIKGVKPTRDEPLVKPERPRVSVPLAPRPDPGLAPT